MSIYLKVPQISGDVTDSQHAGWIRLHSLDWGCERVPLHEPGRIHHRSFSTPHRHRLANLPGGGYVRG